MLSMLTAQFPLTGILRLVAIALFFESSFINHSMHRRPALIRRGPSAGPVKVAIAAAMTLTTDLDTSGCERLIT
jgi:hypothetical protein